MLPRRRSVPSMALAGAAVALLALGGGAAALAADGPGSGPPGPKGDPTTSAACPGATVQSLTTTLTDTGGMTVDVTFNHDIGPVAAAVGAPGAGVLEWGALAPVSGSPGAYTGLFIPPSGQPVTSSDSFLVVGCGGHWLASGKAGQSADTTTSTTIPPAGEGSVCAGASITGLVAAVQGSGVQITVTTSGASGNFYGYVASSSVPGALGVVEGQLSGPDATGTYQGVLAPPGGGANGELVAVVGCDGHLKARTTVGSTSFTTNGPAPTPPTSPPSSPPTTSSPTSSSACTGAAITGVSSTLAAGGTGVTVTITVNHSLGGLSFSSYVRSNGEMVAGGTIPEVAAQPGTYQGTLSSSSGASIPSDATIVFGTCGGTSNRIGGTTTVGSSTWTPLT